MKIRLIFAAVALFLAGYVIGQRPGIVRAQQVTATEGAWEIHDSPFGQQSFYVIKHNRITGQTYVLSGARGAAHDKWLLLPEEDKNKKP